MLGGSKFVLAWTLCAMFVIGAFSCLAAPVSAATGYVVFQNTSGTPVDQYVVPTTMRVAFCGNGGDYFGSYFVYTLKDPNYQTVDYMEYPIASFSDVNTYSLTTSSPIGTWRATLRFWDEASCRWSTVGSDSVAVTTGALPNIEVGGIGATPSPAINTHAMTIGYSISTNAVPFTQTVTTQLLINDDVKQTTYLYGSSGVNTYGYQYSTIASYGMTVRVVTDVLNTVTETSEADNTVTRDPTVIAEGTVSFGANSYPVPGTMSISVSRYHGDSAEGKFRLYLEAGLSTKKSVEWLDAEGSSVVTYSLISGDPGGYWEAELYWYRFADGTSYSLDSDRTWVEGATPIVSPTGSVSIPSSSYEYPAAFTTSYSGWGGDGTEGKFVFTLKDSLGAIKTTEERTSTSTNFAFYDSVGYTLLQTDPSGVWTGTLTWYRFATGIHYTLASDTTIVYNANYDSDLDGLTNVDEVDVYGTNPADWDTDDDGLSDGQEVLTYGTNPLDQTTDGDGWTDWAEVVTYHTNPLLTDTDADGAADHLDLNPFIDLKLAIYLYGAQALDPVDVGTAADFYFKVTVGSLTPQTSSIYGNDNLIGGVTSQTPLRWWDFNVPDTLSTPTITVKIELWDDDGIKDNLCDISKQASSSTDKTLGRAAIITYDLRTGEWTGDDSTTDPKPGFVSGEEDYSTKNQDDCIVWFWLWQYDNDGDGHTFQQEIIRGLNPSAQSSYDYDYDSDGLPDHREYHVRSNPARVDCDGDKINDGYEGYYALGFKHFLHDGSEYYMRPTIREDATPFMDYVRANIQYCADAANRYEFMLSYEWLDYFEDTGQQAFAEGLYQAILDHYVVDIDDELKEMNQACYGGTLVELVFAALEPFPLNLISCWGIIMEWALTEMAIQMVEGLLGPTLNFWNDLVLMWSPYWDDGVDHAFEDGAGIKEMITYGLYGLEGAGGEELISDSMGLLQGHLIDALSSATGPSVFQNAVLPHITEAVTAFGTQFDAASSTDYVSSRCYLKVKTDEGVVDRLVIDPYVPSDNYLRYYTEVEYRLYNVGVAIQQAWYGDTTIIPGSYGRVTQGQVAQDLLTMIYQTIMVMKQMRWLLQEIAFPQT